MATATAIEIKRAKDQETAAQQLQEINARLERIERLLEVQAAPKAAQTTQQRGRAA